MSLFQYVVIELRIVQHNPCSSDPQLVLAPGIGFVEHSFSMEPEGMGIGLGMTQAITFTVTLFLLLLCCGI